MKSITLLFDRLWIIGWGMSLTLVLVSIALIFFYAPEERTLGLSQKIFYLHVPCSFAALTSFSIVFVASIGFLVKRTIQWDIMARVAGEIGLLFATLVLVTGSLWAKADWGLWWVWWDPRLVSFFFLWLLYLAYVMLRKFTRFDPRTGAFAAVYGVVAFTSVPLVILSTRLWQRDINPHPVQIELDPTMQTTFWVAVITLMLLLLLLLSVRWKLEMLSLRSDRLMASLEHGD